MMNIKSWLSDQIGKGIAASFKRSLSYRYTIKSLSHRQVSSKSDPAVKQLGRIDQKKLKPALPYLTTQLQNMDSFNETMLQIYDKIFDPKDKEKRQFFKHILIKRSLMKPSYDTIHDPVVLYETMADILTMYQREYLEYYIKRRKNNQQLITRMNEYLLRIYEKSVG